MFDEQQSAMAGGGNIIGRNIALARANAGVSQTQLAEQIDVPRSRVSQWETGRYEPTRRYVEKIARALHRRDPGWFYLDHTPAPDWPPLRLLPTHPPEEQLAYHAQLLDEAYHAVIAIDADYTVTAWNQVAERLFGWSAEEAIGRDCGELIGSDPARREMLERDGWWHGAPDGLRRGDGGPVTAEAVCVAVYADGGQRIGYLIVLRRP